MKKCSDREGDLMIVRRKRAGKFAAVLAVSVVAVLMLGFTSMAASQDKINKLKLNLKDNLYLGAVVSEDDLEFTTSSDTYEVTEWEFPESGFSWTKEDVPRVEVTVECDDDHRFSLSKDKVKISGDEATVVKIHKDNSQTLVVTVDLQPMSQRVSRIEYAYLNGSVATWAPAEGAASYELYLIRDGKTVGSKRVTSATTYDFGTAMLKAGTYYYRVRAIGTEGSKEGLFTESAELYKEQGAAAATAGSSDSQGSWGQDELGWWWNNPDGSRTVNDWRIVGKKWYFFKENGYMAANEWINWNNVYYYLGEDGAMLTNTQTPDGHTVNADGVMIG